MTGSERYTMGMCKKTAKGEDIFKVKDQHLTSFADGIGELGKRLEGIMKGEITIGQAEPI